MVKDALEEEKELGKQEVCDLQSDPTGSLRESTILAARSFP